MSKSFTDSCKEKLEVLINHETVVNNSYEVFLQILKLQDTNPEVFNLSKSFYKTVMHNSISTFFIEIMKDYDNSRQTLNLYNLLETIKNNIEQLNDKPFEICLFSSLDSYYAESMRFSGISDFLNYAFIEIASVENTVKRVKNLRNKYYAHLDKSIARNPEKLFSKNTITYGEIENLLVLYSNICNGLNKFFNDSTIMPLSIGYNDYENTLHYLIKISLKYDSFKLINGELQ